MAFICSKASGCNGCSHNRFDEDSMRDACFIKQDGPTEDEKNDPDFMVNCFIDGIVTKEEILSNKPAFVRLMEEVAKCK